MNARKKIIGLKIALAILQLLATTAFLYAESGYQIVDERYVITGRTRESKLAAELGADKGMRFSTKKELDAFVRKRAQKLENLRMFKKSSIAVTYPDNTTATADAAADNESGDSRFIPVILEIRVEDGKPYVAIPYAFYNSNDGLMTGVIFSAPNISGTFRNLMLVGLYTVPPNDDDQLQWGSPNFTCMGILSGIKISPFTLGIDGTVKRMNRTIENRGIAEVKCRSVSLSGAVNLTYPFSESVSDTISFRLEGSPENSVSYYKDEKYLKYGPVASSWKIEDKIQIKRFDWIRNFRNGYRAFVSGSYASTKPEYADRQTEWMGKAEFAGYCAVNKRFNPNFRVYSFINSGLPHLDEGQNIRGIRNSEFKGNIGAFLNTSVQIFIVRFGNAELHIAPGIDYGYAYTFDDPDRKVDCGFGAGSELLVLFDSMKNLPIKLGFAYDLRPKSQNGSGKYLEVDFNFSFTY